MVNELLDALLGGIVTDIAKLVKTCEACPSQWDIVLANGRKLYVRYRWGNFEVSNRDSEGKIIQPEIFFKEIDEEGIDGCMTTFQMIPLLHEFLREENENR